MERAVLDKAHVDGDTLRGEDRVVASGSAKELKGGVVKALCDKDVWSAVDKQLSSSWPCLRTVKTGSPLTVEDFQSHSEVAKA